MALINYIEPTNVGALFTGIGALFLALILGYIIYRLCMPLIRTLESTYNKESKYSLLEEKMLDEIAKEKGIDLDKEMLKKNLLEVRRKNFRRKLEDQIYDSMFGKEEEQK